MYSALDPKPANLFEDLEADATLVVQNTPTRSRRHPNSMHWLPSDGAWPTLCTFSVDATMVRFPVLERRSETVVKTLIMNNDCLNLIKESHMLFQVVCIITNVQDSCTTDFYKRS